jgi:CheY-like chemotaxis protein
VASDGAESVAEALPLLHSTHYDVVLLDLSMPEQNGLDLARQVRAEPSIADLRLLMLSSVTALDPAEVADAGVDRALSKPVLSSVLRAALLDVFGVVDESAETDAADDERPSRGRILVVEDNPINQMVATGLLEALGYHAETAEDGLVALDAVRRGGFDAVLMDVQMPRMDGYTATRTLRSEETGTRLPIIAMTAAAVEGEWERCRAAGMDDFLTKPVDASRLTETLERWLRPSASAVDAQLDVARLDELRELDDPQAGVSYIDKVMASFLGRADDELAGITAAAEARDLDRVGALAHKLVGSALNLGAVPLGEAAREVENHARRGALADVDAALPALGERLADTLVAMRTYLGDRA